MSLKKEIKKMSRKDLEEAFLEFNKQTGIKIERMNKNLSFINDNFTNEVLKNARLTEENKKRINDQQLAIAENKELKAQLENIKIGMSIADRTLQGQGEICIMNQNLICENSNLKEENNVLKRELASSEEDREELRMEKEQMYLNNKSITDQNRQMDQALQFANQEIKRYCEKSSRLETLIQQGVLNEANILNGNEQQRSMMQFLRFLSTAFGLSTLLLLVLYLISTNG